MDYKSTEEWYRYVQKQLKENNNDAVYIAQLEELLEQVPNEFLSNVKFSGLKEHLSNGKNFLKKMALLKNKIIANDLNIHWYITNNLEETERITIESPWEFKEEQTISNSIYPSFQNPVGHIVYDFPFTAWFEAAVNLFYATRKYFESHLGQSLEPKRLKDIEIKNLNTFFETGVYVSKSFYSSIANKDVYEYYTGLLWGESLWIGCSGNILIERVEKLEQHIAEGKMTKMEMLADVMQEYLETDWFTSINLQALLWLKGYLVELKEEGINEICLKYKKPLPFDTDLVKTGFQVVSPDKTIQALHRALEENNLIAKIEYDDFKKAFVSGKSLITWLGEKEATHGKGASSLAYLFKLLLDKKIIEYKHKTLMWNDVSKIFKDSKGGSYKARSLQNSTMTNTNKISQIFKDF
jgi:hypothetical protein